MNFHFAEYQALLFGTLCCDLELVDFQP